MFLKWLMVVIMMVVMWCRVVSRSRSFSRSRSRSASRSRSRSREARLSDRDRSGSRPPSQEAARSRSRSRSPSPNNDFDQPWCRPSTLAGLSPTTISGRLPRLTVKISFSLSHILSVSDVDVKAVTDCSFRSSTDAALWTSAVVKLQRLTDCAVNVMADGRYSVVVFEMPLYLINRGNCIFSHRPSSRWYCICVFP